ncbi:MAG TPA: ECF transporter S component [Lachnospiraceae bacterium]|nr:ECF transporter S component [Lachnospiraceae bacterium]
MSGLWKNVSENVVFVLVFLGVIIAMFLVAVLIEKLSDKKRGIKRKLFTTRMMAVTGMFSGIAVILHILEFPLPFLAPGFYELDFSELPVMIGSFAFGPVAGVMIEFCKILLKLMIKGTSTAFVGDLANFVVGCSLLLPASAVYEFWKCRKGAVAGCIAGIICMTAFGTFFNAIYLLPKFVELYGLPSIVSIIEAGTAVNPAIKDVTTFVCLAVAPFNLIKSGIVSLITMLIYKPLSPILKEGHRAVHGRKNNSENTEK